MQTVKRLSCDAGVVAIVEDDCGNVLNIGRKSRTIPAAIKRALRIRDNTCRFPGCTTDHRFCDGHHIEHWGNGGETSLDNLVLLCGHHHRLVHEGGYRIEAQSEYTLRFRTPEGVLIEPNPALSTIDGDGGQLIEEANHQLGLSIDPETCVPDWDGKPADYNWILAGLA